MASELLVNKITPESGTTLTLGESGDTISFASGVLPSLESLTITGDLTVNTDALKVDSTNKFVGIGTASPSAELDIQADVPSIQLTDTDGTNQIGLIYENAGNLFLQSQNDTANGKITLRRYDGSTLDTTITMDSGGGLLLGTTSAGSAVKGDIVVDGNIYLGGTGSANALDDYEEGTFTPTLNFGTATTQLGSYVKVGHVCHIFINIADFSDTTTASNITMTLPFTCRSGDAYQSTGSVMYRYADILNGSGLSAYLNDNSTTFSIFQNNTTGNWSTLQYSELNNALNAFRIQLTYFTA